MNFIQHRLTGSTFPFLLSLLAGCSTSQRQLEAVNKDWDRLIRASHIYPVFPLTQDLQPGDVFLTDTHIEDTQAWSKSGYLRFDHHVARLYPTNYPAFYANSFQTGAENLPQLWLKDNSWSNAPAVAFPTYSFSVKQGGGASVSLPISGIPVGLGLMGAKSAQGYVAIANAHTYGIDESSLTAQIVDYVANHQSDLVRLLNSEATDSPSSTKPGKSAPPRYYLQVVSRVFLTGKVSVSMVNDSSWGGSLFGGAPKDVPIPDITATNAAANYTSILGAVNTNLASLTSSLGAAAGAAGNALPGGTLKFTAVSSRSVSLSETFPKPVVIGYLAISWPLHIIPKPSSSGPNDRFQVELHASGPVPLSEFFDRTKKNRRSNR